MPPITALDLISDAFREAGIIAAEEPLENADAAFGMRKLSRLQDTLSADELYVYAVDFLEFILVPNVQPLLIGQAFNITSASLTSGVATFLAKNAFAQGDYADISGCATSGLNVSNTQVINPTPTSFQMNIAIGNVSPEAETGALAVYTGVTPPNYATFTQRPTKIVNANIVINNVSPIVKCPLRIHHNKPGADWWAANSVPNIPSTIPTDLYYSPQWPNGLMYLWCEQNQTYGLELEVWVGFADIPALTYPFFLPQGYRDMITYTLAETLCPAYGRQIDSTLAALGQQARAKVMELNSFSPQIVTRDPGIPRGSNNRSYFNWLNGSTVPPRG